MLKTRQNKAGHPRRPSLWSISSCSCVVKNVSGTLSPAEVAQFQEDGLLILPCQYSRAELDRLSEALDRLRDRGAQLTETADVGGARFVIEPTGTDGRPRIHRVVWCGATERALAALGEDERVLGRAAQLLGVREVDQLINQAHFKQPGDGVEFPLHQDAWNRRYGTDLWRDDSCDGAYVQVILTVDPMTESNGPLLYVPGSHRMGPVVGDDRKSRLEALAETHPPAPVIAPPGSLVFFGPFLVHGSTPNQSDRPRRIVVNGFARIGVNRRHYPGAGLGVRRRLPTAIEHPATTTVLPRGSPQFGT